MILILVVMNGMILLYMCLLFDVCENNTHLMRGKFD